MFCLVDGNNFYVSCERVFQPAIRKAPVIVLSNNDGCVISRSNEAKALGIKMGEPVFKLQNFIAKHKVQVFSSNFHLYGDMSNRVMQTLEQFSPNIEIYSIDEAFLDLSGIPHSSLPELGWHIKNTVRNWTGIPCGIGISYTKTLAKIANRIAKKSSKANGVLALIEQKHIDKALEITAVEDVWGIGKQYATKLKENGIENAKELRDADLTWMKKNFTLVGQRIVRELRKESCLPLSAVRETKKSITVSRSFSSPITTLEELYTALSRHISSACEKLRQEGCMCENFSIYYRTSPFKDNFYSRSEVVQLPYLSDYTPDFLLAAKETLTKIFKEGTECKKCGIIMLGLSPRISGMHNLFDTRDFPKQRSIMQTLDAINGKMGHGTLNFAAVMQRKNPTLLAEQNETSWKPNTLFRSQQFTTCFSEMLEIKMD